VNPGNDAQDIGKSLRDLGFATIVATDLDRAGMNDALDRFSRMVGGAEIALVYYSGHGMQFAGKNFLLPVEVRLENAEDVNRFRLMPVDDVFDVLQGAPGARSRPPPRSGDRGHRHPSSAGGEGSDHDHTHRLRHRR
jgi:Caspase domain